MHGKFLPHVPLGYDDKPVRGVLRRTFHGHLKSSALKEPSQRIRKTRTAEHRLDPLLRDVFFELLFERVLHRGFRLEAKLEPRHDFIANHLFPQVFGTFYLLPELFIRRRAEFILLADLLAFGTREDVEPGVRHGCMITKDSKDAKDSKDGNEFSFESFQAFESFESSSISRIRLLSRSRHTVRSCHSASSS